MHMISNKLGSEWFNKEIKTSYRRWQFKDRILKPWLEGV